VGASRVARDERGRRVVRNGFELGRGSQIVLEVQQNMRIEDEKFEHAPTAKQQFDDN
jgi:hypothetical protein